MLEANFQPFAHIDQRGTSKVTKYTHQYHHLWTGEQALRQQRHFRSKFCEIFQSAAHIDQKSSQKSQNIIRQDHHF